MKIYGQSLPDIFEKLPWQYKVVVAVGSIFVLFVVVYISTQLLSHTKKSPPVAGPLLIGNTKQQSIGMLDPSLVTDIKTNTSWLAYTSAETSQSGNGSLLLHVRLAKSQTAACDNWQPVSGGGFLAKTDEILAPDGQTVFRSGVWRIETPSLVHDPDDQGKEWKLFAYKYFWANDPASVLQVAQHYGMIVYKYASDPAGEWSTEQWLFAPGPDYPPAPYDQMVLLQLNNLDPSLQNIVAYSRPSVVYKDGALVMTLSAFTGDMTPERVIMVVSRDHGNSWQYIGTPLQITDLLGIGPYTKLGGASLIEQGGQVYLAAVLGDQQQLGKGTFIFSFDNFSKGLLHRDSKTGAPVILHQIALQGQATGGVGGGFAAYSESCPFGLLTGRQAENASSFQIFKTYQQPIEIKK